MRPWYETAFEADYLDRYPHRDDAEARRDVAAIVRLLESAPARPLLDLGCGAGRHLVAFWEAGFRSLVGLDLSSELLDVACRRIAEAGGANVELRCLDMRQIPYENHFDVAVSLFTSFGYFETDGENADVLRSVWRALRPGGRFLVDTLNREWTIAHLVPHEEIDLPEGRGDVRRALSTDGARVEKTVRTAAGNPPAEVVRRESVRMYAAEELRAMFRDAGFTDVQAYGSLRGEPLGPDSRRLIVVGRKGTP